MENQSKKYQIPMIVTDETIRDFGLQQENITWKLIGNRKFKVLLVDATEEQYHAYMTSVWDELKRDDRERRCMVLGKSGKLIRCPESNKCETCEKALTVCKEENRPASLTYLAEQGAEPAALGSFEDEIIYEALLDDLIKLVSEIKPKYGRILKLLYDGYTQADMEEQLGIKQRTLSDDIKKIRSILQPLTKDLFDR